MSQILLVDNGSKRAEANLSLRALAARLQTHTQAPVNPVSLLHADAIDAAALNGQPAQIFAPYLRRQLANGQRDFLVVPLFFGQSRALTHFIPDTAAALRKEFGAFRLRLAPPLCPLPQGEPRLVEILVDHLQICRSQAQQPPEHVFLVDHGSPLPQVTAVRHWLAQQLAERIHDWADFTEAAMERRPGQEYDFNGPLLADALESHACVHPKASIAIAMQFLAAGRHAGPDGDIVNICRDIQQRHPDFHISLSPLMGGHPRLLDILRDRLNFLAQTAAIA
ncbi:sirohydrochlorin chelatase [Rhabdochromatium marinum]|uniref:sirohydrochlorin chelatase n=1 Tax=Rhabdochromatium marinum TaxID=48729 RepID=UPI0019069DC9|nr:CbiX/SirB N-terminal domain-containing protein [Rhabdochromatium marinum]MBK1647941.1 cobalamin biosynthesis protein CbiX [Rhabdochromatium marinum]